MIYIFLPPFEKPFTITIEQFLQSNYFFFSLYRDLLDTFRLLLEWTIFVLLLSLVFALYDLLFFVQLIVLNPPLQHREACRHTKKFFSFLYTAHLTEALKCIAGT